MSGLGSNRSMWLGPPCMNSEIMALARGAWCVGLSVRSWWRGSSSGRDGSARRPSSLSSQARARPPTPKAFFVRKWRRVWWQACGFMASSLDVQEAVRAQEGLTEVRERGLQAAELLGLLAQERRRLLRLSGRWLGGVGQAPGVQDGGMRVVARLAA